MTIDRFWSIINTAKQDSNGDLDTIYESLFCELERLELQQLMEWAQILELYYQCSRTTSLRDTVIEAFGDDDSDYLCGWLLAQGRDLYHKVLQNPGCLVELVENNETQFGEIMSIVPNVYLKKIYVKEWAPKYYIDAKLKYPLACSMRAQVLTEVKAYTDISAASNLHVDKRCTSF